MAHALFANTLAHHSKFEEAIQQIKLASALDPVSVGTNSMAWHVYFSARRYDDALRVILSTIEVDPEFAPGYWRLGVSWEQKGEYQKAIAALHGEDAKLEASQLRDSLASRGARGYWERKLETLLRQRTPEDRYGFSAIARCYMRIGKREEAIASLEKGYEMHDPYLNLLASSLRGVRSSAFRSAFSKNASRSWHFVIAPHLSRNSFQRRSRFILLRALLAKKTAKLGLICTMLSLPAIAQVQNGQIIGVITDPSGAATAGANIYFRNRDTGYEAHIESNDFGIYTARELIVGSYTIHVEVSGFKTIIATNLVVNAGMVLRVDFKLALGQRSETVEVRDAARLINTENSRLSYKVDSALIANLPLNGRNVYDLIQYEPGATNVSRIMFENGRQHSCERRTRKL
jgi:hypothetical protein